MKRGIRIFGLLLMLVVAALPQSAGAAGQACQASRFPFSRSQSNRELHALFDRLERQALLQYFYSELSSPTDVRLGRALATYMIQSEKDQDRRTFFKLLQHVSELDQNTKTARPLEFREICALHEKMFQ